MFFFKTSSLARRITALVAIFLISNLARVSSPAFQVKQSPEKLPLLISEDFEDGRAERWAPNFPDHWQVGKEEGSFAYQLIVPGEQGTLRSPTSWSLLKDFDVSSFVFTGRIKCKTDPSNKYRDMCVFFHFQDPKHFYYVHFAASSDEVHNIIAIVNGKDRVKIDCEPPGRSTSRLVDLQFHDFKVTYDDETGEIKAFLDDMSAPILTATDKTLSHGFMGLGSFDDTGSFDDIKLWGKTIKNEGGQFEHKK